MARRLFIVLFLLLVPLVAFAAGGKQALILYDGSSQKAHEGLVDATHVANLLGHFDYRPKLIAIEDYQAGGMARYDAVFVVGGSDKTVWPDAVLQDARVRTSTLAWIGYGMDAFLGAPEDHRRGLRVDSVLINSRFNRVRYRGAILGKGGGMATLITVTEPSRVKVEAEMLDAEGHASPYMLHTGNLWLVADVPFAYIGDKDRYLAFCDLMHDMLGVHHGSSHRALIRLEDVTPDEEPEVLRRAVNTLIKEDIPFQISLVPVFVDPGSRREVRLSESPQIVDILKDATARGATLVLHGYTHQYRGVTPDDFEFWDGFRNAPRADDSPELVREKLNGALEECFRSGLYPVAWETPHYAASPADYVEFARVFSTFNEETMIDLQGSQQSFPFATVDTRGLYIIPENIGYLPQENPSPETLIENARGMLVVRDGIASAFVHDFLDPRLLQETVRGIKKLGYKFVSLSDFDCRVASDDRLIVTGKASRTITLHDSYLRQFIIGRDGSRKEETWAAARQTGSVVVGLQPGPGEILVAIGMDERPVKPPGVFTRLTQKLTTAVLKWRPQNPVTLQARAIKAAILWDKAAVGAEKNDQESFANTFRAYGAPVRLIAVSDLPNTTFDPSEVLLAPHAAALKLSWSDVRRIVQFVRAGGQLVLDAHTGLSEAVGIRYPGGSVPVERVTDQAQVDLPLQWRPAVSMERFRLPDRAIIISKDTENHTSLAGTFSVGSGKVLYLGDMLDPFTADGVSHYPFLFEHTLTTFDRMQPARRRMIELYFDPGLRTEVSIEDLAVLWRRMGVRAVYASAWVFTPQYTYDYDRLIRVCHANGILVYAWFEFPQVSPLFWAEHPEWREKAAGGEKLPSWRLAMNLANPKCRAAVMEFMSSVLNKWAWDGVNLAELSFDGKADGDKPWAMVPLNDDVRRSFSAAYHFDPGELFDAASSHFWQRDRAGWATFLAYRKRMVTEMHRAFLTQLKPFAASGREVIVTILDSLEHPEVVSDAGLDSTAIVGLMREFAFTLQVEDPASSWKNPPARYVRLADRYRAILPHEARFMIDINVIPNRAVEETHLPVSQATGVELAATVRAARSASDRVALYGDATVRTADLDLISYAATEDARIATGKLTWSVETPYSIEMAVSSGIRTFYRDNQIWSFWRPGFVLMPPGKHEISADRNWFHWFDSSELTPQVLQVSTPLLSVDTGHGGLTLEYDSPGPVYTCLSRKPAGVAIDGADATILPGAREIAAVLVLPAGHHKATIAASKGVGLFVDFVSLISSSLIVAFGTSAIVMLGALYTGIRIRRFFR
ncbi:MAG TPA: DUF2334 domain-containing protein [Syntrophorhabdaceae bacterium]|nr:DUF2334 domain-containing protein [Syntrophorhabdaceae bacterium]